MKPLSTVDELSFKALVTGLNPTVHVLSRRKTLAARINEQFVIMKDMVFEKIFAIVPFCIL